MHGSAWHSYMAGMNFCALSLGQGQWGSSQGSGLPPCPHPALLGQAQEYEPRHTTQQSCAQPSLEYLPTHQSKPRYCPNIKEFYFCGCCKSHFSLTVSYKGLHPGGSKPWILDLFFEFQFYFT